VRFSCTDIKALLTSFEAFEKRQNYLSSKPLTASRPKGKPIFHDWNDGLRTPDLALLFKLLESVRGSEREMAHRSRVISICQHAARLPLEQLLCWQGLGRSIPA
jgi:hypothetical protein